MGNFVIYARESSDDTTKAPSISDQIERGKSWGIAQGHTLIDIYADDGWSGGDNTRPEWNRLMKEAPDKPISIVWVFDQDRIARNVGHFRLFYDIIHACKIEIITATSGEIKMETVGDMANRTAQAMAHEIFRLSTSEKVKSVYQSKKKDAQAAGRKLKWGRNHVPDSLAELARKIRKENPDFSCRKIASMLPTYPLKLREGETEPRMKQVSHAWVAAVLKEPGASSLDDKPPLL